MTAGSISSRDLVESCLERISAREDAVQAWAYLDPNLALAQADAADERREGYRWSAARVASDSPR